MRVLVGIGLVCLSIPGFVSDAGAQEDSVGDAPTLPSMEERQKRLADVDLALPELVTTATHDLDPELRKPYNQALQSYYEYRRAGYDHRLRLFEWQLLSSRVIFIVVLVLVFSGIYFAAVQFHKGLGAKNQGNSTPEGESSEVEMSLKGVKVRSPVLGVVILVISLAFFYLYLVYVYPIENVF